MGYTEYLKAGERKKLQSEMLARFDNGVESANIKPQKTTEDRANDYDKTTLNETANMLSERETQLIREAAETEKNYDNFINTLITECFMEIFDRSLDYSREEYDTNIARAFISNYIKQEGSINILNKMKNASLMLSEMASLIEETCKGPSCDKECDEKEAGRRERCFKIEPEKKNEFLSNLKNTVDIDDVSQSIQLRVANAMSSFINDTSAKKAKIDETIEQIKDKVTSDTPDEIKESYQMMANRKIEEINNSGYISLFEKLVENLSESAYKNDDMKRVYCENGKINFDKVIQHVKTLYTVLEIFNTTKLETFNEDKIEEIVSSYAM